MDKKGLMNVNSDNPILTISLLVGNRKDSLEKCLVSLNHLRETVASELIIVITSDDESLFRDAEKYTDKIYKFEWVNDFSAARNFCLSKSAGKWFMYLDDDEWFEDTYELEDFFVSGKYKNYDACWYVQRNYHDSQGLTYSDDYVSRMIKITRNIRFESAIHEYIEPVSSSFLYT